MKQIVKDEDNRQEVRAVNAMTNKVAAMTPDTPLHERPDVKFSRWLTTQVGVCSIPMSPFYVPNERQLIIGDYQMRIGQSDRL
jgi:aspartate/methionine/tyrosine aminotransferase